jgi:hypothetical protein
MLECASVRPPWILALLACSALLPADTIYLKNGRTIFADKVTENGPRVYYEVGDDAYAIPKTLVDHVETGGAPPPRSASPAPPKPADVPNVTGSIVGSDAVALKIIKDGRVDAEALAALERAGSADQAAAGFSLPDATNTSAVTASAPAPTSSAPLPSPRKTMSSSSATPPS